MSVIHALQTIFEFAVIIFIVWGFFNEDKLISFERRLMASIRRRRIKVIKCKVNNPQCKMSVSRSDVI